MDMLTHLAIELGLTHQPLHTHRLPHQLDCRHGSGDQASALVVSLLTNRAAAAMRLGRPWRALADTAAAAALTSSPLNSCATGSGGGGGEAKAAFRRAQALLAVGACALARSILSAYAPREPELKALMAKAAARAESVGRRAVGFRLVGGTTTSSGGVISSGICFA